MLGRQKDPVNAGPPVAGRRAPSRAASASGDKVSAACPTLKRGGNLNLPLVAWLPQIHVEVASDNPGAPPTRKVVK
eukprot:979573-Alexandrium_andersonii.AAC.1